MINMTIGGKDATEFLSELEKVKNAFTAGTFLGSEVTINGEKIPTAGKMKFEATEKQIEESQRPPIDPEEVFARVEKLLPDNEKSEVEAARAAVKPETAEILETIAEVKASAPGVELDSRGFPWDERIHAGTKTKTANGAWKYRQGIDRETLVPQVEAELKGVEPQVEEEPKASPDVVTFPQLVNLVTSLAISAEKLAGVLAVHGIATLPLVNEKPELIPVIAEELMAVA